MATFRSNYDLNARGGGGGTAFTPTQENMYEVVKEIFHPASNSGVTADDTDHELDIGASISASATDTTARNAAAAAKAVADAALPKAGGTMTGKITLDGAPTSALHPVTKTYADAISRVALAALPLAGGTLTGTLTLKGDPSKNKQAATKKYVDDKIAGISSGSSILDGTREPKSSDGVDGNYWIAGLDNGTLLSIWEKISGTWVELARGSYDRVDIDALKHLTRDLHVVQVTTTWKDAADADADVFWTVPVNGAITLVDTDFDNKGASTTIPSSTSERTTYVFVRLAAATDVTPLRVNGTGGYVPSNNWALAADEGVTVPDNDSYQYWMAVINLNETAAETWKVQKREEVDETRFDGELGGKALEQAQNESRFTTLEHLTRDLHLNEGIPAWDDAADSDGDIFQVLDPGSALTLTDANFDNNGARVQIPNGQNADTLVYVRLPAAADHKKFRITFDGREPRGGNTWRTVTGPDTTTYQYWFVISVNNFGFSFIQLEKRSDIQDTTYTGKGAIPEGGNITQLLAKKSSDDYDVQWVSPTNSGTATDTTARASAAAAKTAADAAKAVADAALPKAGGTMTGKITLDGAPTNDLHAATKKYVDENAGNSSSASNVPNPPAADTEKKKYNLTVATDGTDAWEEDLSVNFTEFDALPDVDDFDVGNIVGFDDKLYKLEITDESTPNLYEATVGRSSYNVGNEHWRGVATSQSPNGFSTDGGFSANPDNAIIMIMASDDRHIRVVVKQSVFEAYKGSDWVTTDKLHMTLALQSGDSDVVDMSYYSAYERDTHYLIFQHRHASDNYNLYDEAAGNNLGATFKVGSSTGTVFSHAVSLKHWVIWNNNDPGASDGSVSLNLARANAARLDAIDNQVDGSSTPTHSHTFDDTTALTAPAADNSAALAVSEVFNNVEPDDLLVVDWTKCEHLNDHSEHVLPGSTTDAGRMYFHPNNFGANEWDGEFIYALEKALQDNGAADTLNSWIVGVIEYSGTNLTFGLHLQQGGPRTNRNLKPRAGFSLTLRVFRNTTILTATEGSVHAQLKKINSAIGSLSFVVLTDAEYTALATKDDDTIYFTTAT